MWPFKKKNNKVKQSNDIHCVYCGSKYILKVINETNNSLNLVTVWRGQRYLTCKCKSCNRYFYIDEADRHLIDLSSTSDMMIEDEEQLKLAEEELKQQADTENDHRYH